ncbi:citrate transporter [Niameybacter massiliensis]|uniref:Citrate transporter n=1 Tax=Holtiella tumoricola TaxID=3018743 RepID=A0AA42DKM4_9FIRM|nr:SLC13 family permease [Holtiella tumoricola]MDA3730695.1 citrate transporter [Holtiella tumoricola]
MKKQVKASYVNFLIGFAIMILFRFIPLGVLPNVTEIGLQVMGVFIGTIYLWSTVNPTVASIASICMLAMTDFAPAGGVLSTCFGNPTVVQMFFLMVFMGGLTNRKLTVYIARWIMTRKFIEGKPWVFTLVMMLGTYLMSVFIGAFAPIFLFWPILYGVFEEVGYEKTDEYPKLMVIGVVISALAGFPVPPYMSNGLALLGNYRGLLGNFPSLTEGTTISDATYFIACFILGLVLVVTFVGIMKFIFRPDVTPMKKMSIEMLERNPLPAMSKAQKTYGIFLCIFIFCMLIPSLLPNVPVLSFINKNSLLVPIVLVCILSLIQFEDGPVLRFGPVMGQDFAWPTFFLCTSAILIGGVLTNEATGVTPFLNTILSPIFNGMSGTVFTVVLLVLVVVLTNICNSLVIGMIMQPVVLTYCVAAGVSPAPIITLLIFTVLLTAACTPAASPFAAMLFGNKEYLTTTEVYKYTVVTVVIELLVILVLGIPFVNLFM